jgi:hypothetical protein
MKHPKKKRADQEESVEPDSEDQFAFIVGYTEGGTPYGITWEELQEDPPLIGASLARDEDAGPSHKAFHSWAPDLGDWPQSWMGIKEDLEYGRELLPYFVEFLQSLYNEGISRKTFVQYRDNLWRLGGSIITRVSSFEAYHVNPLDTLIDALSCDGLLPDDYDQMNAAELRTFSSMCRRFDTFLQQRYGINP